MKCWEGRGRFVADGIPSEMLHVRGRCVAGGILLKFTEIMEDELWDGGLKLTGQIWSLL